MIAVGETSFRPVGRSRRWCWHCGIEQSIQGRAADAEHSSGAEIIAVDAGQHKIDMVQDGAVEVGVVFSGYGDKCLGDGCGRQSGDIERPDPLAFAIQRRAVNDVLEFADVARPEIRVEARQREWCKSTDRLAVRGREALRKKISQQGEVVAALAQRRDGEASGGETVAKVGP